MKIQKPSINSTVAAIVATVALVTVATMMPAQAYAQAFAQARSQGAYELITLFSGIRAVFQIVATVAVFSILAFFSWKQKPKDWYDCAYMALAWCAFIYVVK